LAKVGKGTEVKKELGSIKFPTTVLACACVAAPVKIGMYPSHPYFYYFFKILNLEKEKQKREKYQIVHERAIEIRVLEKSCNAKVRMCLI
jgi:hypothetical protein